MYLLKRPLLYPRTRLFFKESFCIYEKNHFPPLNPQQSFAKRIHRAAQDLGCMNLYSRCIWSVLSSISYLNRSSSSLYLFCHVLLKRSQWDWDWRLRSNKTPHAIGYANRLYIHTHILHAYTYVSTKYMNLLKRPLLYLQGGKDP